MIVGPCLVVTGGDEPQVIEHGAVRVVGAHVAQVGPASAIAAAFPDETLWPARGRVLIPGLVNAHAHLGRHLARGLGLRTPEGWANYERALSPEDVYWSALAALVEGVRHGVTTVCDFHRSSGCLDLSLSEIAGAARKLGVRVATCYGAAEGDTAAAQRDAVDESVGLAAEIRRRREGKLRALLGVRAESLAGVERLVGETLARAGEGLPVHIELALDATPGERWAGDLGTRVELPALWAHAEQAPRRLLSEAHERGDALAAIGAGATAALGRELTPAWGSDGGINAPPFGETTPWTLGGQPEPHYRRCFVSGSRWAAGPFGERLGEIVPGAPADLVLIDYQPATELSARTLAAHIGSGLLRGPVSGAMVAGEVVLDDGALVTVDEREVAARARECAARLWRKLE
ncbi:MAG TPA: amidohydrolase family protein [Candidatus Limnocylindria bacterium]|nr:amidohydrolase family protein [Candidatus Limnocylindria bacterium]